jgi:general secretion pathway protein A
MGVVEESRAASDGRNASRACRSDQARRVARETGRHSEIDRRGTRRRRARHTPRQLPHADADLAVAEACAPELAPGVSCLRGHASLDSLVAIGRPVLLHLRDGDHATWALLLGSDGRRVRLQLGDAVVDVPRVALPALWRGEYWAIWRAGDATPPPDVRRFQAAHGLPVDGVLGPETRYALATDGPGPRLTQGLD